MNYINPDPKISLLLQKAQKEDRKDSFHILKVEEIFKIKNPAYSIIYIKIDLFYNMKHKNE